MKTKRYKFNIVKSSLYFLAFIAASIMIGSCDEEVVYYDPGIGELVITEYVEKEENQEQFSEFNKVLQATGINNLLRVRGPFTLMLPTNDAMQNYYSSKNVSSYSEIDISELEDLVYNHLFEGSIPSGAIGQGSLLYKNGLGDDVACDLVGSDIQLNKKAIIIDRDVLLSNGYVHHIDHVLEPVTKSIFDVLSELDGYSIFTEGIERSGLKDTLQIIEFPYGNTTARTRYTLLTVPDTLYMREGINTIDDLIAKYSNGDDLTDKNNEFYKYMEFHCISGTHYFSDFDPSDAGDIYYLISYDNYISIVVSKDYEINSTDEGYTGFYYEQSNIPAKNGTIHTVNDLFPAVESEPREFVFQTTDYFDLQQGAYYGNNYARFYDGENTFEHIKWDAEYLMYYFKNEDRFWDTDGLSLSGHFWIELTLPKIRKGTYNISPYWFGGGLMAIYIDGEYFAEIDMANNVWESYFEIPQNITFTETKEHTFLLKTLVTSSIWWDRIRFTPVE